MILELIYVCTWLALLISGSIVTQESCILPESVIPKSAINSTDNELFLNGNLGKRIGDVSAVTFMNDGDLCRNFDADFGVPFKKKRTKFDFDKPVHQDENGVITYAVESVVYTTDSKFSECGTMVIEGDVASKLGDEARITLLKRKPGGIDTWRARDNGDCYIFDTFFVTSAINGHRLLIAWAVWNLPLAILIVVGVFSVVFQPCIWWSDESETRKQKGQPTLCQALFTSVHNCYGSVVECFRQLYVCIIGFGENMRAFIVSSATWCGNFAWNKLRVINTCLEGIIYVLTTCISDFFCCPIGNPRQRDIEQGVPDQ